MTEQHLEDHMETVAPDRRILKAAVNEFATKGFFGARTQAIAEAAGVNKAMLHYYFRSKEKLYQEVIRSVMTDMQRRLSEAWLSDAPFEDRLDLFVDTYMDLVASNPGIIKIVFREVVDGGHRLRQGLAGDDREPRPLDGSVIMKMLGDFGAELGGDSREGMHTLVNLIGMCIASFTSPLLLKTMAHIDTPDLDAYLADRRASVKNMLRAYASSRRPARKVKKS